MLRYQTLSLIALIVGWLFATGGYAESATGVAGYVTRVRGEVVSEAAAGRRPLALGHALHLGDRLITGVDARLELGGTITVGPDLQDENGDGLTATQLVMVQGDVVTVLANHLVAPPDGAQPTADNSGFWVTPRDAGVELMIRAQGRTARGRIMTTSMSQFAAMRN